MRLTQRIGSWQRKKNHVKVIIRWYDLAPTDSMPRSYAEQELRYPLTKPDMDIVMDIFRPDRAAPIVELPKREADLAPHEEAFTIERMQEVMKKLTKQKIYDKPDE